MASARLERLPPEVLENIATSLSLGDIRNLRRTCRALGEGTMGPRFLSFFAHQVTDLTPESLRKQGLIAAHPTLGSAVKSLTIEAVIYDVSEAAERVRLAKQPFYGVNGLVYSGPRVTGTSEFDLSEAQTSFNWIQGRERLQENEDRDAITDSLASLLETHGRLDRVNLEARLIRGPGKAIENPQSSAIQKLWIRATQVFQVTMSAMAASKVAVCELLVYQSLPRCSISLLDLGPQLQKINTTEFTSPGSHIEILSISVFTKALDEIDQSTALRAQLDALQRVSRYAGPLWQDGYQDASANEDLTSVACLLRSMPNLKSVDLHLRAAVHRDFYKIHPLFNAVACDVRLHRLEKCGIRGIPTTLRSLVQFLKNHPTLREVDLCEIRLADSPWRLVFEELESMSHLRRLKLSNLWDEENALLNLQRVSEDAGSIGLTLDPGMVHPYSQGTLIHTREFDEKDLLEGLRFEQRNLGLPISSQHVGTWMYESRTFYGIPL